MSALLCFVCLLIGFVLAHVAEQFARTDERMRRESIDRLLKSEIEKLEGVRNVSVTRNGNRLKVKLTMNTAEFSAFERVVEKEVEFSAKFPGLQIAFEVELQVI